MPTILTSVFKNEKEREDKLNALLVESRFADSSRGKNPFADFENCIVPVNRIVSIERIGLEKVKDHLLKRTKNYTMGDIRKSPFENPPFSYLIDESDIKESEIGNDWCGLRITID